MSALFTRVARDDDSEALISLIAKVYEEYADQGVVFDLDELPELRAIASYAETHGGSFRVAEDKDEIVACIGWVGVRPGVARIERLYVDAKARRLGLGGQLLDLAETELRAASMDTIELWSDTRFVAAHHFYERRGYTRGAPRQLEDKSHSLEFYFSKIL